MVALAAANFLWQLGSSSYFVDEVESVTVALHPFGGLLDAISANEISPPAYFAFLHEWLGRVGSSAEWVARLPSALCGALLVGAVYWLASILCRRRAVALVAALLTALSPFVLEYAQLAQGYVFVMLAVTVAAAATLRGEQSEPADARRPLWLTAGAIAAITAIWLHYTAALAVFALCVWVLTRPSFPRRWRVIYVGSCLVGGALLTPLLVEQYEQHKRADVAASAGLTLKTVERVFGTPLIGRVDSLRALGTLVVIAALTILAARGRGVVRERRLLIALAAGIPLALLVLSALGAHLMLTRYAASAAPFMIVAIAVAIVAVRPRVIALLVAAAAVLVAGAGLLASHQKTGYNVDAREAARYVLARGRPGDVVLSPNNPGSALPLHYYGLNFDFLGSPDATALIRERTHRLWVIQLGWNSSPGVAAGRRYAQAAARKLGYRVTQVRVFPGAASLIVTLAVPRSSDRTQLVHQIDHRRQ